MSKGSEDHIIIRIMENLYVFLSRIEATCRLSGPRFDLVEMGDVSCILNGKSGRIMGERTKMG